MSGPEGSANMSVGICAGFGEEGEQIDSTHFTSIFIEVVECEDLGDCNRFDTAGSS